MEVPGVTKEAVARFSFSAEVAMFLLESIQKINFTEAPNNESGGSTGAGG